MRILQRHGEVFNMFPFAVLIGYDVVLLLTVPTL